LAALALAFLAAYAVPILNPSLPADAKDASKIVGLVTWAAFAVDYLARLLLATERRQFVRQHILDLLVVCLPLLRPLRLLRLILILHVLNRRAVVSFRGKVVTYVVGSVILVAFLASLAVLDAERGKPDANITTYQEAAWWTISTMTTVGYGDRYPTTGQGRLVAVGLMIAGIALLGVITAAVAAWFVEHVQQIEATELHTQKQLEELKDELRRLRDRLDPDLTGGDQV
jgi:voltage-gated potassium channel